MNFIYEHLPPRDFACIALLRALDIDKAYVRGFLTPADKERLREPTLRFESDQVARTIYRKPLIHISIASP